MSIVRGPRPESGWYALDKRISEDDRLSWAARGLLVYLLGKPDHWEISIEHLRRQTASARIHSSRDALYAMLGELETAGYLNREQANDAGRYGATRYIVRELPAPVYRDQALLPLTENPATVEPLPVEPYTDRPDTGQPYTANPLLVNTDISVKTEDKQGRAKRAAKKASKPIDLPAWVPVDAWIGWLEMRDQQRKSPTDRAQQLALRELGRLKDQGHDPRKVIDQSTLKNWTDFYAIKPEQPNAGTYPSRRRESDAERAERFTRIATGGK